MLGDGLIPPEICGLFSVATLLLIGYSMLAPTESSRRYRRQHPLGRKDKWFLGAVVLVLGYGLLARVWNFFVGVTGI